MKYNFKNLMYARNAFKNIPIEEIEAFESEVYMDDHVLCVDAVHPDPNPELNESHPYPYEGDGYSSEYTWYLPMHRHMHIQPGHTLVVEQTVGIGLAFVKAVSHPYTKTREQHESEVHPYCKVIDNLGDEYL